MYHLRNEDKLFVAMMTSDAASGVRAAILSGPPGVGKTSLGEELARHVGAQVEYLLCHHWITEEDLFIRIDPARVAAVAGRVPGVSVQDSYRAGVLLRATELSRAQRVVVIIDELDKAPERVDALLLDFLQTGRVHGPFGEVWQADLSKLSVVITTNDARPLSEALQRRCYRYAMTFLPANIEQALIREQSGAPVPICKLIVAMMTAVRSAGASSPSLQEGVRLAQALRLASSSEDVRLLFTGWLCKQPEDWQAIEAAIATPHKLLFSEVKRWRTST